jgi:hypothetical protein
MRKKMVVVDEYPFAAIIRDNTGLEVQFQSAEDFTRITGASLDGSRINYEPDRGLYIVDEVDKQQEIPDAFYEDLLSNIQTFLDRQADPTYGMTGKKLFDALNENEEEAARVLYAVESEAPVEISLPEGTFTFNGGNDSASYISGGVTLAQALGETDVGIWDIDNEIHTLSFDSAMIAAVTIAKEWRDKAYVKQTKLSDIKKRKYQG